MIQGKTPPEFVYTVSGSFLGRCHKFIAVDYGTCGSPVTNIMLYSLPTSRDPEFRQEQLIKMSAPDRCKTFISESCIQTSALLEQHCSDLYIDPLGSTLGAWINTFHINAIMSM